MPRSSLRLLTAGLSAAMLFVASPTFAQSTDQKPAEKPPASDAKDAQKKIDEFAEAEKLLGGPAANPECLWLGRRVVSLLWRDDLDTAFRHLDLYDRFGCPAGRIQATFRCLVRQGNIDPKAPGYAQRAGAYLLDQSDRGDEGDGGGDPAARPIANLYKCSARPALSCTDVQND